MKFSGFKYLADQGVENIWKNKMMAFATFCVLLISLVLVGASVLFYINIDSIIGGISDKNEIVVFLDDDITEEERLDVQVKLTALDGVSSVEFQSKETALNDMIADMPEWESIFESLNNDNPLVDGYKVKVDDLDKVLGVVDQIRLFDNIYYVRTSQEFVTILKDLRRIISLIASAIIIALSVVSIIMISNTTKSSVFARREEIQIMKYVGATNGFIRFPFFIEGMVTGFFSGFGAYIIVWLTYDSLFKILTSQGGAMTVIGFGNIIPFSSIRLLVLAAYLLLGALVGALGSVVFTRKHINV